MLVLALESATEVAEVALVDEGGVVAQASSHRARRHVETFAPAVEFVCGRAGVRLAELDAVAVDVGPGLFTGLRVALGTAKALAFALGVPVVCATSLEVLAEAVARNRGLSVAGSVTDGASQPARVPVVAVVDARRGEVFWGHFELRSAGEPAGEVGAQEWVPDAPQVVALGGPCLGSPESLAGELAAPTSASGAVPLLVGDGARRYSAVFAAGGGSVAPGPLHPPAGVLGALGIRRLREGKAMEPERVLPLYLRDPDTRINWEKRPSAREAVVAP